MDDDRWLTPEQGAAWMNYLRAVRSIDRAVSAQLTEAADLSHLEYEILHRLSVAHRGRLRMGVLAENRNLSNSRLNYQITALVKRGLVARETDPEDGRGLYTVITREGLLLQARIAPGHVDAVKKIMIDPVGAEDFVTLSRILGAIHDNLASADAAPSADGRS